MAFLFRWLLRLTSLAVVLCVAAILLVYWFASRSLPDYDATTPVAGISAPVEVVRDNANVPHIFGTTDADVYFALGYVHAQDRLWQMTMLRRTAQGRLSELFGVQTLETDELMRRFDLHNLAVRSVEAQSPETLSALEAYSAGVNAWINEVNAGARGRGAPEMWTFNHAIAYWQPADSIAILKLMAIQASEHLQNEVLRTRVTLTIGPERLADIMPDAPGTGLVALPEIAALFEDPIYQTAAAEPWSPPPFSPFSRPGFGGASNAWAAAPHRSATGSTLLANDPHLGFSAPSIWYLARIELQGGGVIGGSIPGVPIIMLGRSADLGWGLTSAYLDDQDLYIEEVNPERPNEYRTPEGWVEFVERETIVNVAEGAPVTFTLRWTQNGPVLPPDHFNLGLITPEGHVTSLAWTALSARDTTMTAAFEIMQARTVDEAISAAELYVAPAANLILAGRNGIALKTIGVMPRRNAEHQTQGRIPSPGWIATNRWDGRMAYAANPEFIDPAGGILGNTNNKTVERPFPNHVSFLWGDTQRINRWRLLMQEREVHTRESFVETQLDDTSYTARALLPLIGADLWFTGEAAAVGTIQYRRKTALELLGDWDGEMGEHMAEPLIYAAWVRALQRRLIQDDLGPLARAFPRLEPLFIERVFRNVDGAAVWCDVEQSAPVESCSDLSRLALDDALVWIDETYGVSLEALRWGDAHQAIQDHPVWGDVPVLSWFVNIRQSTSGGDNTLRRGLTSGIDPDPFSNVHGAGYRGVYDFADPDSSLFIISTGQSGHFLSRHYDDLGELWRRGEYIPMSLDPALARAAAVGITTLVPAE